MTGWTAAGQLADTFAVIDEARAYGYDPSASFGAVIELLDCVDEREAKVIAAMLAALVATHLRPLGGEEMATWAQAWESVIAGRRAE